MIKLDTNTKAVNDVTTPLEGELRYIRDGLFLTVGDGRTLGGLQISTMVVGAGAPVSTPTAEGLFYLDTTANELYLSTGTASSADWTLVGSGGGGVVGAYDFGTFAAPVEFTLDMGTY